VYFTANLSSKRFSCTRTSLPLRFPFGDRSIVFTLNGWSVELRRWSRRTRSVSDILAGPVEILDGVSRLDSGDLVGSLWRQDPVMALN
jgi:hypothetical protein